MDAQPPTSPSEPKPDVKKKPGHRKLRSGLALAALITVLLLAGGGLGYYAYHAWLGLHEHLAQAASERQALAEDIATLDEGAEFLGLKKELQRQLAALEQQVQGMSRQLTEQASLHEDTRSFVQQSLAHANRSQFEWGLNEALYILHLANHRLLIEHDISGAVAALNIASTRLHELKEPRLLPVRESISRQVQKLDAVPEPDWVGIGLQLNNVLARVRQHSVDASPPPGAQPAPQAPDLQESQADFWQKLTGQVRGFIDDSITITRKGSASSVAVEPRAQIQTHEFLQARLLSAQYALASRNRQGYHRELQAALAWLESTAPANPVSELAGALKALDGVDLEPELPDISEPARLLADLLENPEDR